MKKDVWKHIIRLIAPHRKRFLWVVTLGLLSTGVGLLEPLIYRTAINDVAGIFVRQARENAQKDLGLEPGDASSIDSLIKSESDSTSKSSPGSVPGSGKDSAAASFADSASRASSNGAVRSLPASGLKSSPDSAARSSSVALSRSSDSVQDPASDSAHKPAAAITAAAAKDTAVQDAHRTSDQSGEGHVAARSPRQALNTLLWAVLWLFLINLAGTMLWRLGENTNTRLSCLIEQRFIQNTFAHVLNLPLSFFSRRPAAAIAKQIDQSEEVTSIVNGFSQQILPELISLLGIIVIMCWQNVSLTLVALITIPFYILIAWRSAGKLETGLSSYYARWEDVSARIQDGLTGIKTVKLSGAEKREASRLKAISDEAYADYVQRARLANKYVFWETMLSHLSTALVFGYGGYLTLQNKLTPGDVVMFVAYLDRLYGPIDTLASLWVEIQQNVASIARAFRLLDNNAEPKSGLQLSVSDGKISFENVVFGYTPQREVLKDVSFVLAPGKATAIVGASGAGKTTTVDLLLRLYDPQKGRILIDGQDIATLDPSSVRGQIGMVSTDGAVFHGTLADNIRYKRPEASDEDVLKAAMAAGLHATLERLPEGIQTEVGDNGIGLSVGERQRIQIARVLCARPRVLILDEATANLDFATEAEVKIAVDQIRKEHTVIIIAHRYSMVRDADQVIVLADGKVIEQGSPAALIEQQGWFAEFANAANEQEEESAEEESEEEFEEEGSEEEGHDEEGYDEENEEEDEE